MRNGIFFIIVSLIILGTLCAKGQKINTGKQKLNEVLNELRDKHSLLISFDDAFMKTLTLPKDKSFKSLEHFFKYLTKNYPISIKHIDKSIILYKKEKDDCLSFYGRVYDSEENQGLPNAEITIDNIRIYTSQTGYFSYISSSSNIKRIIVRHLGYNTTDTICKPNVFLKLPLSSHNTLLKEVNVNSKRNLTNNTHIGKRAGVIKLNPKFIQKLPGYGETSIYTFLRLMPGVLATGENSNDISIRGSSEGQNAYIFDGYKIYNPWYKLNEIGTINPLLIKDIEIYKAGYDSSIGENIGGIVKISGQNSIPKKKSISLFVNNFIINTHAEFPISKKSTLIVAARKNIKNTINSSNNGESPYYLQENPGSTVDNYYIYNTPIYSLADLNIKYLQKINKKSGFHISLFGSYDRISVEEDTESSEYDMYNSQNNNNNQYAASFRYYNNSNSSNRFEVSASFSKIHSNSRTKAFFNDITNPESNYNFKKTTQNSLEEYTTTIKNQKSYTKGNSLEYGLGATVSIANSYYLTNDTIKLDSNTMHHLIYGYANFNLNISERLNMKIGTRINYSKEQSKLFFEPRISADYYVNEKWKVYASSGIYNQFVYKSYILDKFQNNIFKWTTCNKDIPTLISLNNCIGARYTNNNITLSSEIFFKHVRNKIKTIYSAEKYLNHKSRNMYYGTDIFAKYQTNKITSWVSYTYSSLKDKEYWGYDRSGFDNKHEIKYAISYNLNSKLTFSANYIYGSGFKRWHDNPDNMNNQAYKRFDIGAFYKFKITKIKMECGCSVLNLLNYKNTRLDEFTRFGVGDDVINYPVEGLKLTPTFFIKISI